MLPEGKAGCCRIRWRDQKNRTPRPRPDGKPEQPADPPNMKLLYRRAGNAPRLKAASPGWVQRRRFRANRKRGKAGKTRPCRRKSSVNICAPHRLLAKYGYHCALYGHFGDAVFTCAIALTWLRKRASQDFRAFVEEAADMVVEMGGSLSGSMATDRPRGELL